MSWRFTWTGNSVALNQPATSLNDILAIDGNRTVYLRLQKWLADRSAMAFVGAGASFPLYPLWNQFIEKLADEAVQRERASDADRKQWLRVAAQKPLHVAARIRERLKDQFYHTFLFETFRDRAGSDGQHFTPAHAALVRTNFKALLTTNYDPGLVEARRVLRPDIRDTGFTIWNQDFAISQWLSGDLFRDGTPCPILFAHGHYADPAGIVLDTDSYRRAYHDTPYRRMFENLWLQEHLVFIGFSFNDLVLGQIANEVLWRTARHRSGEPRHVAILGLPAEYEYSPEMRREYLEPFNAEVIFYPVGTTDDGQPLHSALQLLLDSLILRVPAEAGSQKTHEIGEDPTERRAPKPSPDPLPVAFIHESTEDEKFTGRADMLTRLDTWAREADVRLIGVTAIGGLGKTALVGHWSKSGRAAAARRAEGLFFWSYYRDRDTGSLLRELLAFGRERLKWKPSQTIAEAPAVEQAVSLLSQRRVIVVLDGLEAVQEAGTVTFRKLLEPALADFLHRHLRGDGHSLVLLTSRFPFPDLTPYLGGVMRPLGLPELDPSEGGALLAALGVAGQAADREEISCRLSGHPLALRIFALSSPVGVLQDPTRLWQQIFDSPHLADNDSLGGKMKRLLLFYEQRLSDVQRQALGLLALFRAPVGERTLALLWELFQEKSGGGAAPASRLRATLDHLHREHLLTADNGEEGTLRYACHPILRDHFRGRLIGQEVLIRNAAKLLADRPDEGHAQSLESIDLIATAIEVLLDAGEFKAADDLFRGRLGDGNAMLHLPAPHLGMEVAQSFVRDQARRRAVGQILGAWSLGRYLNAVGAFAYHAGEPETALEFYWHAVEAWRHGHDEKHVSLALQNLVEVETSFGLLDSAEEHAAESLTAGRKLDDREEIRFGLVWEGFVTSLRGDLLRADAAFEEANEIEKKLSGGRNLFSFRGVRWAEHLLRSDHLEQARRLTEANHKICREHNWQDDIGRCEWMLGWLDVVEGRWDAAIRHLEIARAIFVRGHMIYELARVLTTELACRVGQGDRQAALLTCEQALQLAAPRNYRLIHADVLVQRSRIWLSLPTPNNSRARDDAEAALVELANPCGYAWGQRDASELLAVACRRLHQPEASARYQAQFDAWTRRLTRNA